MRRRPSPLRALLACVALTTAQAVAHTAGGGGSAGPGVPRLIHQTFLTALKPQEYPNEIWKASAESWRHFFPEGSGPEEYTYKFWTQEDLLDFFSAHCAPSVGPLPKYSNNISVGDLGRYCILWVLGGVYADLDYEPRAHFYDRLVQDRVNLIENPYKGEVLQNSLMASPPGLPYWLDILRLAQKVHFLQDEKMAKSRVSPLYLTGPRLLERLKATLDQGVVHRLPCRDFQRAVHVSEADEAKGCGHLNSTSIHQVQGIHWGTWSWFGAGGSAAAAGANRNRETAALFRRLHSSLPSESLGVGS